MGTLILMQRVVKIKNSYGKECKCDTFCILGMVPKITLFTCVPAPTASASQMGNGLLSQMLHCLSLNGFHLSPVTSEATGNPQGTPGGQGACGTFPTQVGTDPQGTNNFRHMQLFQNALLI